ncbi:ankyrin repeat domain-containing protein 17 [Striga asiatica]|uniref:Ankyrin repeat domain-containing protein 17 n=1 Tax=Striga asiatica TaxID=4170 RepID=A0A5A7QV04_STRAF|nr:ankyrin repeat domain-containing protein 17 [Striga asiatica]
MVEKELKQGGELRDCHYASHLQHLIKFQRKPLFLNEQFECEHVKEDLEMHEEDDIDLNMVVEKNNNVELSLGKNVKMRRKRERGRARAMDFEWKNEFGEFFMRRCDAKKSEAFGSFTEKNEEEEEEEEEEDGEDENKFGVFPCHNDSLAGDGFSGNFFPAIEENNQMAFNPQVHLRGQSSVDMPIFFTNRGKRVLEQNDETHLIHHNESNKKLRISNFGTCVEQIQNVAERARTLYEEKTRVLDQTSINQQIMLSELQKRDSIIEHLHRTRYEEAQKKDGEIYRLERELYLMGSVLEGYRKALKETRRAFAEYREEEEFKMNCFIFEKKMNGIVEDWDGRFSILSDKVCSLEKKLTGLEADAKELIGNLWKSKNGAN